MFRKAYKINKKDIRGEGKLKLKMSLRELKLNDNQLLRYSKQLILKGFNQSKQEKLLLSKVLVIGAGGLGSSALYYLAAAGVGCIGVMDFDVVKLSNLNSQIIHSTKDLNRKKVESATEKINALNEDVVVVKHDIQADKSNIGDILIEYDLILECSDSLETKLLINEMCILFNKPLVVGGISGFDGIVIFILPNKSPCYRCFNKYQNDRNLYYSEEIPVIGMIPGIVGIIQALEAVKFLVGIGEVLVNKVLYFSGINLTFKKINLKKDPNCTVCSKKY